MGLLVEDLRNRRVVRVAVRYVLTAVAVLLGMGMIDAALGLPDWAIRMVAGIAFFALPFLLVMIWALDDHGPETARLRPRVGLPPMLGVTGRTDRIP